MERRARLGQHFLASQRVLQTIADAACLTLNDTVLEIGPGKGALTGELLRRAKTVLAVERDARLSAELKVRFQKEIAGGKLVLVTEDARNLDPARAGLQDGTFKLVANIPYYITGELLRLMLGGPVKPALAVLLIQKEVAERIARSKKESILSISVKTYGAPRYVKTVKRSAFTPPPRVDSAILSIGRISRKRLRGIDEAFFFSLVKAGFSRKRKYLKSNLKGHAEARTLERVFSKLKIPVTARAEDVPFLTWIALARALKEERRIL